MSRYNLVTSGRLAEHQTVLFQKEEQCHWSEREAALAWFTGGGGGWAGGLRAKWAIRRCHQFQCMPVATETEVERFFLKDRFKTFRVCRSHRGRETLDWGSSNVPRFFFCNPLWSQPSNHVSRVSLSVDGSCWSTPSSLFATK